MEQMRKLLIILPGVILPDNSGGQKCMYYHVMAFIKAGFEVSLVMGNNEKSDTFEKVKQSFPELKKAFIFDRVHSSIKRSNMMVRILEIMRWLLSGKPRGAQLIASKGHKNLITNYIIDNKISHVLLEFPYTAEYIDFPMLKKFHIKVITIEHNVEYLFSQDFLEKYGVFALWENYLCKIYERNILRKSNFVFTISPADRDILKKEFQLNSIVYQPTPFRNNMGLWKDTNSEYILFTGFLNFNPNYHGLEWFLREIYMDFREKYSTIKLKITGKVEESIKRKFKKYPVEFTGFLSDEEMEKTLLGCLFEIVPIMKGSGIKIKLLEALSMGIPTIATKHCFEGIPFDAGDDPYIVADNKTDFLKSMFILTENTEVRKRLGKKAKEFFEERYASEDNFKKWAGIIYK